MKRKAEKDVKADPLAWADGLVDTDATDWASRVDQALYCGDAEDPPEASESKSHQEHGANARLR